MTTLFTCKIIVHSHRFFLHLQISKPNTTGTENWDSETPFDPNFPINIELLQNLFIFSFVLFIRNEFLKLLFFFVNVLPLIADFKFVAGSIQSAKNVDGLFISTDNVIESFNGTGKSTEKYLFKWWWPAVKSAWISLFFKKKIKTIEKIKRI